MLGIIWMVLVPHLLYCHPLIVLFRSFFFSSLSVLITHYVWVCLLILFFFFA